MTIAAAQPGRIQPAEPARAVAAGRAGLAVTPTGLVIIGAVGAAFVALFHYFFYVQNFQAMTSPDWSHSYFIPLITLYLLWVKRAELAALRPSVFWPGVIPIVMGIMCYALFQLDQARNSHMLRGFSMILCLLGIVLLLLGPAVGRAMFLPIAYLGFGVTLAEKLMLNLTVPLRMIATEGSFRLLSVIGVEAERNGTILDIKTATGSVPLNVADACAGMRMVIAFVALAVAVALVSARHWWQRVALLLLAVPVAVGMNVVRVAVLGLVTLVNPKWAAGDSHMLVGYILLVPAFFIFMGAAWALGKVMIEAPEPSQAEVAWWRPGPIRWTALARPAVVVTLGLLTASAVALPTVTAALQVVLRKAPIHAEGDRQVRAIPAETANWKQVGPDVIDSAEMLDELGTRNTVTRQYARKDGGPGLQLHLAYYTGGVDAVPHVVERCMVAGGWEIASAGSRVVPLRLDRSEWIPHGDARAAAEGIWEARLSARYSDATTPRVTLPRDVEHLGLRVTEFVDPKHRGSLFAGYFFLANGGYSTSAEGVRLLAFDLRNQYAFYCKVQVSSASVSSAEALGEQASSLLGELLPEIMRCVPDWVKVERGLYPAAQGGKTGG